MQSNNDGFANPLDREFWLIVLTSFTMDEINKLADYAYRCELPRA